MENSLNLQSDTGLGSRSRVILAPWSRSRLKKNRSRSRFEKKSGAGAAKNLPAPQPCEKIKSIRKLYFSYSSLGKILSFMVKKKIILLVLYFFAVLPYKFAGKRIFCQGAGAGRSRVFLAPWSRSRSIKNTRSRSRLRKKSGAGAA